MSERSERDTYGGNTIENRGCLFIGERAVDNAKSGICSLRSLDNEILLGVVMCVWMVRMPLKHARGNLFSLKTRLDPR